MTQIDDLVKNARTMAIAMDKTFKDSNAANTWRAVANALEAQAARVKELEKALDAFARMERSITADVSSAHSGRGDAASDWMREDDADMRKDLRIAFDNARALMSALRNAEGEKNGE